MPAGNTKVLLYPSVSVDLSAVGIASQISVKGIGAGYHTAASFVTNSDSNNVVYAIREAESDTINGLAYLEIFKIHNGVISFDKVLRCYWTNKILVGDLVGDGTSSIVAPSFTDNDSLRPGTVFLSDGKGDFNQIEWLDLQQHGPSIGQFTDKGKTYFITPAEAGSSIPLGTYISWYEVNTGTIQNKFLSPLTGASSVIIPATKTSQPYLFLGQQSGSIYGGYDAFIPIEISADGPRVNASVPIQFEQGFWTPERVKFAESFPSAASLDHQYPLSPSFNTQNHAVEARMADFNSDGLPDVVVTHLYRDPQSYVYALTLYLQKSNGGFEDVTDISFTDFDHHESGPYRIFVNDINKDGHPDIVFGEVNWVWYTVPSFPDGSPYGVANSGIYLNDGLGHFVRAADDNALYHQFQNNQVNIVTNADGTVSLLTYDFNDNTNDPPLILSLYNKAEIHTGPNGINTADRGVSGFNEWFYLKAYSDAAAAVQSGQYQSGLDYYLAVGKARGDEICAPNTRIFGSDKVDTFQYHALSSHFNIGIDESGIVSATDTSGAYGTDWFQFIERLQFNDTNIALDYQAGGHAGQAYRLYKGVLGREGEPGGLGYVMNRLDQGETLKNVASGYLNSPEFLGNYGNADQPTFINLLYQNILGRAADASGTSFINNWISSGATREDVVLGFTESPEYIAQCITLIGNNGIHYNPVVA